LQLGGRRQAPEQLGEKIIVPRRGDQRGALHRAEFHVGEEMGV